MIITLNNTIPHPMKEGFNAQSDIWLSDYSFEKSKNYLVTAPSGRGKSTFLHILYGLRKDFDGQVSLNNQLTSQYQLNDWANIRQQHLSIVFQNLRLFPQLTGLENIQIKNNLSKFKNQSEIEQMATQLGVKEILQQTCGTMSYGQRQRIAIIRALSQPFSFLLLDEPFSHLDHDNITKACDLIKDEVKHQKAGMILVSLGEKYGFDYDNLVVL